MASPSSRQSEKHVWLVTTVCVSGLLGFAGFRQWINTNPEIQIPQPEFPKPNAWDYYQRAVALRVRNKTAEAIKTPTIGAVESDEPSHVYSLSEKEQLLQPNLPALNILRQGFAYRCHVPTHPPQLADYDGVRDLFHALILEAQIKAAHNDYVSAINSCLDAIKIGVDIPRGGYIVGALFGAHYEAMGRRQVWEWLPKLSATEARAVIHRLQAFEEQRQSSADAFREEHAFAKAEAGKLFRQKNWRRTLRSNDEFEERPFNLRYSLQAMTRSKRAMLNALNQSFDAHIAQLQKPYAQRQFHATVDDPLTRSTSINIFKCDFDFARNETEHALLLVTIALHAFQQEHGIFPQALDELSPFYLNETPRDPFDHRFPLRYQGGEAKYLLYSVGPDGIDNGGRPAELTPASPHSPFTYTPDSRGDIVVGFNVGRQ